MQSQKRKLPCNSLDLFADVLITIITQFVGFKCQRTTMRLINKRFHKIAVECLRKGCEHNLIEIHKDKWHVAIYSMRKDDDLTFQNNKRIFRDISHYNWNWTLMLCFDDFNENNVNNDNSNFINQALECPSLANITNLKLEFKEFNWQLFINILIKYQTFCETYTPGRSKLKSIEITNTNKNERIEMANTLDTKPMIAAISQLNYTYFRKIDKMIIRCPEHLIIFETINEWLNIFRNLKTIHIYLQDCDSNDVFYNKNPYVFPTILLSPLCCFKQTKLLCLLVCVFCFGRIAILRSVLFFWYKKK